MGELHWLTTHTRPDSAYYVGVASRLMHKRPRYACHLAEEILKHLKSTKDLGLRYEKISRGDDFGEDNHLRFPRSVSHVEAYADASFAPACENYRSIHGTVTCVAGCAVLWSSMKQGLVAQSAAEAELLAFMETFQQAEGVAALLEVLEIPGVHRCLYGDDRSALALCQGDAGAWRTRHLRLRAAGLRESLMKTDPVWWAHHVQGSMLMADLLTKPVQGSQHEKLAHLLGLRNNQPCQVKRAAKELHGSRMSTRERKWKIALAALLLLALGPTEIRDLLLAAAGAVALWIKKNKTRWDREDSSPVGDNKEKPGARENEPDSRWKDSTKSRLGRPDKHSGKEPLTIWGTTESLRVFGETLKGCSVLNGAREIR